MDEEIRFKGLKEVKVPMAIRVDSIAGGSDNSPGGAACLEAESSGIDQALARDLANRCMHH